jgi:carbamate kinase
MLVVIAIGGRELVAQGHDLEADAPPAGVRAVTDAIAEVAAQHDVVVTHGSASQVGLLAYQSALLAGEFGRTDPPDGPIVASSVQ